jgi:hypothetical protein
MRARRCVSLALLAGCLSLAAPAFADRPPLSESLTGDAKAAFDSGTSLVNNQDFAGALLKLSQAYDLSKDPRLLYNMAICEKNLHHYTRMRALLERYASEAGTAVDPTTKANVDRALDAVKNLIGTVTLTVSEPGATVSIDGGTPALTPLAGPLTVDQGRHTLLVEKDGYEPVERPVDVMGGKAASAEVTLRKLTMAHLAVSADAGATIKVDGKLEVLGRFDGQVDPGTHELTVTEPDRKPYSMSLTLREGEARSVTVTLDPAHPRLVWPWIVGGAALVAAGAVIGGYALAKSGSSNGGGVPDGSLGNAMLQSLRR